MRSLIFFTKSLLDRIPTLLIIATLVFFLVRAVPGGPFDSDKVLPPQVMENLEKKFRLNLPVHQQYFEYFKGIVFGGGDFGPSYKFVGRDVREIIFGKKDDPITPHDDSSYGAVHTSLELGILAMLIAVLIGIPLGIIAAYKHNTAVDHAAMFFAIAGQALPSFGVAALLIYVFAFQFRLFPVALWDGPEYMVLPVVTLGIRPSAYIARLTRASLLDTIRADFVRTARAKGLSESVVLLKHVLKNSLIPVITVLGPLTAGVVAGSFIIEYIFAIPGMGWHFVTSVQNRDYSLVMGISIVYASLVVFARLLVDITYAFIDPRIRVS